MNEQGEGGAESLYLTNKQQQNKKQNNKAKQTAAILCREVVIFAMFVCLFFNEGVVVCVSVCAPGLCLLPQVDRDGHQELLGHGQNGEKWALVDAGSCHADS